MKPSVVAAAVFLAGVGQAFAADFPVPAPGAPVPPASYTPVLPPYTNWSGLYIGLNGGYDFGTANWNSTGNFSTRGGIVGGTIGVNFPYGPVIFGFEGDIDWADVNGNTSPAQCFAAGGLLAAGPVCEVKISTIGTARARLGYSFDRALVFVSAGGAFGFVRGGLNPPAMFDSGFALGWAAGGGVEFALVENWTVKAEYLFVNLGNVSCNSAVECGLPGVETSLTESIVRAGVNYKFSW